jgi:hypothetical protein
MTTGPSLRSTLLLASALAMGCAIVAVACSSSDNPAPAVGSTGTTTDASSGGPGQPSDGGTESGSADSTAPDGAIVCPVPALGGAVIVGQFIPGLPPTDLGGPITPGTYDLTRLELYLEGDDDGADAGGPDGGAAPTAQATFVISASMLSISKAESPLSGGALNITMSVAKVQTSDVFIQTDETCPTTNTAMTPYTATSSTITLHTAQRNHEIYTRRP